MKKETTGKIVINEIDDKVILYNIELREKIQRGEGKRTLSSGHRDWGWVYVDLDKDDMPLAVTLIVSKKKKTDNEKD